MMNAARLRYRLLLMMACLACCVPSWSQSKSGTASKPSCSFTEFRLIGLTIHDPEARLRSGLIWLRGHLPFCNLEQVRALSANRAHWFGVVDGLALATPIDRALEILASDRPDLIKSLYASNPPDAAAAPPPPNTVSASSSRFILQDPAQQAYQQYYQQQQYQQQQYQQPYGAPHQPQYPQAQMPQPPVTR